MLTTRATHLLPVLALLVCALPANVQAQGGLLGFSVAKEQVRLNFSNSPMPNLEQPLLFDGTSYNILLFPAPLKMGFTFGLSTAPIGASPEAVSMGWGGVDAGFTISPLLPKLPPPMLWLGTAHMGLHVHRLDGDLLGTLGTGSLGAEVYLFPIASLPVAVFGRAQATAGWAYVKETSSWNNFSNGLVSGGSLSVGVMLGWVFSD